MEYFKVNVFILIALAAVTFTYAQNNTGGQSQTDNVEPDEKTSLEKGMEPIFSLYQNFLLTVMPDSFYSSDTPFNVQKLNQIVKDNDFQELQANWKDLVSTYGGIAACIICGLLFVVFMPLIGLIYCCCHCCCHKCGGTKQTRDPKKAGCMRITFSAILMVCATMVLVGCIITFLGSELLKRSLQDKDNKGLLSSMDSNLGLLQTFANTTLKDVKTEAREQIINKGLGTILPTIEGAANDTVKRVKTMLNTTVLFDAADNLGKVAETALVDIQDIRRSLADLTELQTNTSKKLQDVRDNINTTCTTSGASECPDTSGLAFTPDFSQLDQLNAALSDTQNAQDIRKYVKDAKEEFDKVSNDVFSAVGDTIQSAKTEVEKIKTTVNDSVNQLDGTADPFISSIQKGRNFVTEQHSTFVDVGNYIWYVCIGMGCAVLLVVLFYYLGVLFGLCGERPGYNAACCNRGTGANLICAGIFFSFLFAALLMFVVILLFTVGGLSYTMACQYLDKGIENVDTMEQLLNDGFKWNVSSAFGVTGLSISGMFRGCKANQGIYTALHLNDIFDIDKQFNVTEVEQQVNKMTQKTFTLTNITLLSTDLKTQLDSLKNSGLAGVNFTQYTEQLDKPLTEADLSSTISQLEALAASNPAYNQSAQDLRDLQNQEIAQITAEKDKLKTAVERLQRNADVTDEVDDLANAIQNAQDTFNTQKNIITKEGLTKAVDDIIGLMNEIVNDTKDAIKNRIGKCKPLYVAAQNVADAVCVATLNPANAIWFGLGWSLFFYIPCLVFAALLSGLYQRSEMYVAKDKFDDPNYPGYAGYDSSVNRGNGGRNEDFLPLTSSAAGDMRRDRSNGNYNQGYDSRESVPESRYHRDGNYPESRGGPSGHVYDMPMSDRRPRQALPDSPPHYDEAIQGHGQVGGNRYKY